MLGERDLLGRESRRSWKAKRVKLSKYIVCVYKVSKNKYKHHIKRNTLESQIPSSNMLCSLSPEETLPFCVEDVTFIGFPWHLRPLTNIVFRKGNTIHCCTSFCCQLPREPLLYLYPFPLFYLYFSPLYINFITFLTFDAKLHFYLFILTYNPGTILSCSSASLVARIIPIW